MRLSGRIECKFASDRPQVGPKSAPSRLVSKLNTFCRRILTYRAPRDPPGPTGNHIRAHSKTIKTVIDMISTPLSIYLSIYRFSIRRRTNPHAEVTQGRLAVLSVCLHWLCTQGSFEHARRRVENYMKIVPRRVENRPGGVQNRLLEASGGLLGARWTPFDRQGRSEAEFGRLLGRSWGAPGGSWGRLGASWAAPGVPWGAPGTHFGLPGSSFWSFLGIFCRHR